MLDGQDEPSELFRSVVATVREPLLVLDADMRVRLANDAFYRNFHVAEGETAGRRLYDLGNGQWDIPALRELLEVILPTQNPFEDFRVEHDFPHLGPRTMLLNARQLEGRELILLAVEDVTERELAEARGREAAESYKLMVDSVSDYAIFMLDADARVKTWNEACERVKGWKAEEVIGRYFDIFHTPEDREAGKPEQELEIAKQEGKFEEEGLRVRSDGSRYWAKASLTPIRKEGELVGFAKVLQNIEGRKRAEEALREADRRKNDFLAMLAHELRNPLAPIRNALAVLGGGEPPDPETLGWACSMMGRQVDHLVRLVDDLLDVSRIMRGKVTLQAEAVDLASVVARAVETSTPVVAEQGHELAINLSPEPLPVEADPVRLAQVFANLLNNAAKYTEPGGHIRLDAHREDGEVVVTVRDTGVGIPAEELPHIFGLFTQGDRTIARSQGGLGIGLTVVENLVRMHGGEVEASSAGVGRGSELNVRLPLARRGVVEAESGDRGRGSPGRRCRVLVVDDNRDAATSLARLLGRLWNQEVRTAHDGHEALTLAREFGPEMILLDIGLPGLDGYEVARRLRGLEGHGDTLLVALTGYGQDEDRRKSGEAGFDFHLVKPVEPGVIRRIFDHPTLARCQPD